MCRLLAILMVVALTGTACAQDEKKSSSPFTSFRDSDAEGPAGNFSLTDRSGQTVHARDLRGVIWVAQFFYPGCNECSKNLPAMRRLQEIYRGKPYVRLVSFALDYGDAETLDKFAEDQKAEPGQWLFLADKDKNQMHDVARHSFGTLVMRRQIPPRVM